MAEETVLNQETTTAAPESYSAYLKAHSAGTMPETPVPDAPIEEEPAPNDPAQEANSGEDGEPVEEPGTSEPQKKPNKVPAKDRIAELTAKRGEAERERDRLAAELETLKKAPAPAAPPPQATKDWYAADADPKDPMPTQDMFKSGDAAKDWQDYQDARADWRGRRTWAKSEFERGQRDQQAAFEADHKALNDGYREALDASPVKQQVEELYGKGGPLEKAFVPQFVADFIKAFKSPKLAVKLGENNGAELKRIAAIRHPMMQNAELVKLYQSISESAAPARSLVTKAPKPITVLGGKGSAPGKANSGEAENFQDFLRLRQKEVG